MKTYCDSEDVLNTLQILFDWFIKRTIGIDGMALLLNSNIIARSEISEEKFDTTVIASLLANLSETTTDTLGDNISLYYVNLITQNTNGELQAWTIVYPYKNYKLIFSGKIDIEEQSVDQATVLSYVRDIVPFIKSYDNLT
ncbi:MAG: hypothetical protein F6J86_35735 [Symploca sp. SIO1B1]|nr:hypothetical protein [Symploca sp. SIO1A3]NER99118.1 hypothetical protein [Symploca sp. SIO1B1]